MVYASAVGGDANSGVKNARAGCDDKDMKTYHDPTLPLNEELVKSIINFVESN